MLAMQDTRGGLRRESESMLFIFRRTVALNTMHPEHSRGLFYYLDGTAIGGMSGGPVFSIRTGEIIGMVVRVQPQDVVDVNTPDGVKPLISPEHLTIALQSFYIHAGLDATGVYL